MNISKFTLSKVYPIIDIGEGTDVSNLKLRLDFYKSLSVNIVQLRNKTLPDREMMELARGIISYRNEHYPEMKIVINDRIDICILSGADGVHVGQDDLSPANLRFFYERIEDSPFSKDNSENLKRDFVIGVSTHGIRQFEEASKLELTYVAVGPIFSSATKSGHAEEVGLENLKIIAAKKDKPLVAIGGITLDNLQDVISSGADSVAIISDLEKKFLASST